MRASGAVLGLRAACPVPRSRLRATSRQTVDLLRPSREAMADMLRPHTSPSAMNMRSSMLRYLEPVGFGCGMPAALARDRASAPMLRGWSTTTSAPGNSAKRESSSFSLLATGTLSSISPSRVATHAQCDDFPTSSPMTVPGLLGGAMAVSSNRQADREPSLRHLHYLAVAPAPGSFPSVVRSGERLR